jgi:pimeloyl-ACP methyl ester carboxylesterase
MSETSALWYSSADGLSLFARRFDGKDRRTPVLCLHDIAETSRIFAPLADELCARRTVLVPDLRGHGRSDYALEPSAYSIENIAKDALALLDVEEIRAAAVIGCGLGGTAALTLAADHPKRIAAIVLCESGPDLAPEALRQEVLRTELAASLGSWEQAEQALPTARLILRDDHGHPTRDWDPVAAQQLLSSLAATKPWGFFGSLAQKPMLAVRGATSTLIDAAAFEAMARRKSDLKRVSLEGVSDARRFDRKAIIDAIAGFLGAAA